MTNRCPCLSGETYENCCGPLHEGSAVAPTAERLMRSRYSAFAVGDSSYLVDTYHSSTRPANVTIDPEVRWMRLDIDRVERGGPFDTEGVVAFTAHYRANGVRSSQHESSRFVRENGRWYYVDAID